MTLKRLIPVFVFSVMVGHLLGHVDVVPRFLVWATTATPAQAQTQARDPNALPPAIPPVPKAQPLPNDDDAMVE